MKNLIHLLIAFLLTFSLNLKAQNIENVQDKLIAGTNQVMHIKNGDLYIWGPAFDLDGISNIYLPTQVSPKNGFFYDPKEKIRFATLGGEFLGGIKGVQGAILTETEDKKEGKLYIWGAKEGMVNRNSSGFYEFPLPEGVLASDIDYMEGSEGLLVLLTKNIKKTPEKKNETQKETSKIVTKKAPIKKGETKSTKVLIKEKEVIQDKNLEKEAKAKNSTIYGGNIWIWSKEEPLMCGVGKEEKDNEVGRWKMVASNCQKEERLEERKKIPKSGYTKVGISANSILAYNENGKYYSWGPKIYTGVSGIDQVKENIKYPYEIASTPGIAKKIKVTPNSGYLVLNDKDELWVLGNNQNNSMLGYRNRNVYEWVKILSDVKTFNTYNSSKDDNATSSAILKDGRVMTWGKNDNKEIKNTFGMAVDPTFLEGTSRNNSSIANGYGFIVVYDSISDSFAFSGKKGLGRLGTGDYIPESELQKIPVLYNKLKPLNSVISNVPRVKCDTSIISESIVSGHLATVARLNNTYVAFGQNMSIDGESHLLRPTSLTPENGFRYKGIPIAVVLGDYSSVSSDEQKSDKNNKISKKQGAILTDEGLYIWGTAEGMVSRKNPGFSKMYLPSRIFPKDIKNIQGFSSGIAILTKYDASTKKGGEIWIMISNKSNVSICGAYGQNCQGNWMRVGDHSTAPNSGYLELSISETTGFAYNVNTAYYTWGSNAWYIGNKKLWSGTAPNYPLPMTTKGIKAPKKILTLDGSYYVIDEVGESLFVLGDKRFSKLATAPEKDVKSGLKEWDYFEIEDLSPDSKFVDLKATNNSFGQGIQIAAITDKDEVYVWGEGTKFYQGNSYSARKLKNTDSRKITEVALSGEAIFVYDNDKKELGFVGKDIDGAMGIYKNNPRINNDFQFYKMPLNQCK